jgi:hypothetical protein
MRHPAKSSAGTGRRKRLAAAITAGAITAGMLLFGPFATAARTDSGTCGEGRYIKNITVEQHEGPDFKIIVTPTRTARDAILLGQLDQSTIEMWHAIQGCVPGLYHGLADSIWQQLKCHQMGGPLDIATGPTYDLESWHVPLAEPGLSEFYDSHCLNKSSGEEGSGINFPGALDLNYGNHA